MKILMVCAEFAPWAKTGGLADAVAGLSDALARSGHDVRVLLPRYSHLAAPRGTRHTVDGRRRTVPADGARARAEAEHAGAARRRRASSCSSSASSRRTPSIRATRATPADSCTFRPPPSPLSAADGWRPDVVHCHDWHTALVPVFQRLEPRSSAPSVLTLHNVGYQGVFADAILERAGLRGARASAAGRRARGRRHELPARRAARRRSRHDREPDLCRGDPTARVRHGPRGRARGARRRPHRHLERRRLRRLVAGPRPVPGAAL